VAHTTWHMYCNRIELKAFWHIKSKELNFHVIIFNLLCKHLTLLLEIVIFVELLTLDTFRLCSFDLCFAFELMLGSKVEAFTSAYTWQILHTVVVAIIKMTVELYGFTISHLPTC
jgi:hypothetical protein